MGKGMEHELGTGVMSVFYRDFRVAWRVKGVNNGDDCGY